MICNRIRALREQAGYSQAQLARKLDVTRSSVNAWEMGLSTPTTQYVVAMARLFHVSVDYMVGHDSKLTVCLDDYSDRQVGMVLDLLKYFDEEK